MHSLIAFLFVTGKNMVPYDIYPFCDQTGSYVSKNNHTNAPNYPVY